MLALKVIPVSADEAARRAILLELKTLHESRHPSIVSFYGAFHRDGAVHLALEYMDATLLELQVGREGPRRCSFLLRPQSHPQHPLRLPGAR